jgi:hypothetical protein
MILIDHFTLNIVRFGTWLYSYLFHMEISSYYHKESASSETLPLDPKPLAPLFLPKGAAAWEALH